MYKAKKVVTFLTFGSILAVSLVAAVVLAGSTKSFFPVHGDDSPYQLTLNSNNRIYTSNSPSESTISSAVNTSLNNPITISGHNIKSYSEGWQTILPNGYVFNDLTNDTNHNRISGITSIEYEGNGSLSFHYGYTLDNSSIIYSIETTLTAGVEYVLDEGERPSYFYLKNNSSSEINIQNLKIKYTCSEQSYPRNNLNILMIGNSFADDTIYYAKDIANAYGINLNIYNSYIAGCTVDRHYQNLTSNSGNTEYSMRSTNENDWVYNNDMTLTQIINSHTWDIITFQQASAEVGRPSSYSNLSNLVSEVRSLTGASTKNYWYQTWAYDHDYMDAFDYFSYFSNDQDAMFAAINTCYQNQVAPLGLFEKTVFAGTAVQNLRSSYMGDTFTRDGKHMSSVHGRYLLGLNFISNVLNIDLDLCPCSYVAPEINGSFIAPAYESVRNARNHPYAATQSIYTQKEMANYDLSNYTEIDAGFVGNSYYNSMDENNYSKRIGYDKGVSEQYVTTKRFTSSTLPVGSLVFSEEAFGYRPESWTGDYVQSSRPNEMYDNVLEITNSFWSGYAYHAFNIFKAGKTTLMGQYHQIFDGFRIFVPNNALNNDMVIKGSNPYASSDSAVFIDQRLNFDAYERVNIDPIYGYLNSQYYATLENGYAEEYGPIYVCTRPFFKDNGDLPKNTVIITDTGYKWRSDAWHDHGKTDPRPNPVTSSFYKLDASFMDDYRLRTFNISKTNGDQVGQNAIEFANHVRIYVPISDDVELHLTEKDRHTTFSATGTVNLQGAAASLYGSSVPLFVTLTGDSDESVYVTVAGNDVDATDYVYDRYTHELAIHTEGSASTYTYGTITGYFYPETGTYSNVGIDGTLSEFVANNGNIIVTEKWFDRCNYTTEAEANTTWQRWDGSSWTANTGNNYWTVPSQDYTLENDYSLGLHIGSKYSSRTRFTLKQDLGGGNGIAIKGFSIWLYNPNGAIYSSIQLYVYKTPSSIANGVNTPSGSYSQLIDVDSEFSAEPGWHNLQCGFSGTAYNISIFFQSTSEVDTYVYLGHVSLY